MGAERKSFGERWAWLNADGVIELAPKSSSRKFAAEHAYPGETLIRVEILAAKPPKRVKGKGRK